ncbi:hypothetical protein ACTQ5A_10150 [Bacillota bacterium LCP21S3_F9]|mgnify:FL=1
MCEELERYIDEITEEMQTKVVQLQASNSEKDRALFENSKIISEKSKIISEKNKAITEKDKEIARLNELVASLSKGDSRPANS